MSRVVDDLDDREEVRELLMNLQAQLPALEKLLTLYSSHWGYEDPIYRFYHHSFKVWSPRSNLEDRASA